MAIWRSIMATQAAAAGTRERAPNRDRACGRECVFSGIPEYAGSASWRRARPDKAWFCAEFSGYQANRGHA